MLRDNKNLFEQKEENCYKLVRVNSFWSNNYIEYENNSDRNKTPSVEENLDKISLYLKVIKNNLKKSDTLKIQLTIAKKLYSLHRQWLRAINAFKHRNNIEIT